MNRTAPIAADAGIQTSGTFAMLALALVVALPPVVFFSTRAAAPMVALAAAAAFAAWLADGGRPDWKAPLARPLAAGGFAFGFVWLALGAHWPIFLEALGSALVAAVLFRLLPRQLPRWFAPLLALVIATCCLLLLYEFANTLAIRRALGLRPNSFVYNRPVIVLAVLFFPLAGLLAAQYARRGAIAAAALGALVAWTVWRSDSGAATLAIGVSALAFGFARLAPRLAIRVAMAAIVVAFAIAPVMGDIVARFVPPGAHERLAEANTQSRTQIWQSFGALTRHDGVTGFLFGQGFGKAHIMRELPVAMQVPEDRRTMLGAGHTHNSFLQVWVERGLLGALAACAALLWLLWRIGCGPREAIPGRIALIALATTIATVGHGAWQGWWIAILGLAAALLVSKSAMSQSIPARPPENPAP